MKKTIGIIISIVFLFGVFYAPVFAQETATSTVDTLKALIESLQQQILQLQQQVEQFKQSRQEIKETVSEIKDVFKLNRQLEEGMTGDDVEDLQEILATDPEIYPKGLVTGYFGSLTKAAVKRFQKKVNIEQVGRVGPKTLAKINYLLSEGAGSSGKVPPGLLIAPGIRKKLGEDIELSPLAGQKLPFGIAKKLGLATSTKDMNDEDDSDDTATTTSDNIAPVISDLSVTDISAISARITWTTDENADSKAWYILSSPVDTNVEANKSSSDFVMSHVLGLSDLATSTTYYYVVGSMDEEGNSIMSEEDMFSTLAE